MDQSQLQEKIALYYQKLPEETKVLFASMSWLETLKELDTKYGLSDEQIKTLGTETTILLLGIIHPEDYVVTIQTEIKLEGSKTEELIKEINEKILKDISPKLYEAFNNNIDELIEEKYGAGFLDKFSKLPEEVKNAISDSSYQSSIYEIGKKYSLNIDKLGELEEITTKVLTGVLGAGEYENEVKNKIGLPDEKNKEMVSELNLNIFKKIKDIMQSAPVKSKRVPLPPYKIIKKEEPIINTIEEEKDPLVYKDLNTVEIKDTTERIDPYKEHGIEILSKGEVYEKNKEIIKSVEKKSDNVLKDTLDEKINGNKLEVNPPDILPKPNIMMEKLTKNTLNTPSVSDYSLPRVNNNHHDPYHEEI